PDGLRTRAAPRAGHGQGAGQPGAGPPVPVPRGGPAGHDQPAGPRRKQESAGRTGARHRPCAGAGGRAMNARRPMSRMPRMPRQGGQGTIEFYLMAAFVLIPLFMGILQLGLLVMAKNTLNVATLEA